MLSRERFQWCLSVLDLNEGASAREVSKARRRLVKIWHPDRFAHNPELQEKAQEKVKDINQAHRELKGHFEGLIHIRPRRSDPPEYQPEYQQAPVPEEMDSYWKDLRAAGGYILDGFWFLMGIGLIVRIVGWVWGLFSGG